MRIDRRTFIAASAVGAALPHMALGGMEDTGMTRSRELIWRRVMDDMSFEHAAFRRERTGVRISGRIMTVEESLPLLVDYVVTTDAHWYTRTVEIVQRYGGGERRLRLDHDGAGRWRVNGQAAALDGCLDVDLGLSPSTNALPVNRLGLPVGSAREIRAAWVRFPALEVVPARQSYERLGTGEYRYRNLDSDFTAVVRVDADGLPTDYEGIWRRIAEASLQGGASMDGTSAREGFAAALIAAGPSATLGPSADDFSWLIGGWLAEVRDFREDGRVLEQRGEWWFAWVLEGRAIQDVWIVPSRDMRASDRSASGPNRYGTTLRWFDAVQGRWKIHWINSVTGATNRLAGSRQGNRIILLGEQDGRQIRWSFADIARDSFNWLGETRMANGFWRTDAEFRLRRVSAA